MERLNKADCRQEKTGSCYGCPAYNTAYDRLKEADVLLSGGVDMWENHPNPGMKNIVKRAKEITEEVNNVLCPEGKIMQGPKRHEGLYW